MQSVLHQSEGTDFSTKAVVIAPQQSEVALNLTRVRKMKRGEIWLVDFAPHVGAEITKQRPAVIVSATGITGFPTRIVVPFRDRKPYHTAVQYFVGIIPTATNGLAKDSTADCVQIKSLDTGRFIRKLGVVSADELDEILDGIALCVGL